MSIALDNAPQLVNFGCVVASNDAMRRLFEMGMRPATAAELKTFGKNQIRPEFDVVALGSVFTGVGGCAGVVFVSPDGTEYRPANDRYVMCLCAGHDDTALVLSERRKWNVDVRFIAVNVGK